MGLMLLYVLYPHQVATQAREMSAEDFSKFLADLTNNYIYTLINSQLFADKIAAIMTIGTVRSFSFANASSILFSARSLCL